ncbi:MAG: hypothetical protein WA208_21095 [Thermoanaerobaculia bacterium]
MNIDYGKLEADMESGAFRLELEAELTVGFRQIADAGERLPPASHYAAQIAEIVNRGAPTAIKAETAYYLYQEILEACEAASAAVLGAQRSPS